MNALQQVISEAMAGAGAPSKRGSKAWLARRCAETQGGSKRDLDQRSRTFATIISNIFSRDNYLPDEPQRAAIATALGIRKSALDDAEATIKGLGSGWVACPECGTSFDMVLTRRTT